jgi:hypothetical protein
VHEQPAWNGQGQLRMLLLGVHPLLLRLLLAVLLLLLFVVLLLAVQRGCPALLLRGLLPRLGRALRQLT